MAARAVRHEHVEAVAGVGIVGRGSGSALRLQPLLELRRRLGDDEQRHVGVLQAAELRALAAIGAGPVGAHRQRVRLPWDEVHLAGEIGHPEAVDRSRHRSAARRSRRRWLAHEFRSP